jgi:hypothetical protein
MIKSPLYSVHYSSDEHDSNLTTTDSLFEATCEFYYMIDDLEDDEWITLHDANSKVLKIT